MHDSPIPRRLSPTSLDRFRTCPRLFLWHDIEQLDGDSIKSPELVVGTAVHHTLELAYRLRPQERSEVALHRLLGGVWRKHWRSEMLGTASEDAARRDALGLLTNYAASFHLQAQSFKLEQWAKLRVGSGVEIRTRIDRVDRGRHGLRLIDYKTGRRQIEAGDFVGDSAAIIHLLAVTKQADVPVERLSHFYLRTGEEVYWEPEAEDVEAAAERLKALLQRLFAERQFAPAPGPGCRACPFSLRCEASPPQVDLETLLLAEGLADSSDQEAA